MSETEPDKQLYPSVGWSAGPEGDPVGKQIRRETDSKIDRDKGEWHGE
jgi:hypothetical protein